jgi:hypothetical protein
MLPADAIAAFTVAFIVGMVWLRTRMHYPRGRAKVSLTRAGRIYFAVLLAVLVLGWLLAPAAARALWPAAAVPPLVARVVWFLATYYLFIPVHRMLKARGVEVFKSSVADVQEDA